MSYWISLQKNNEICTVPTHSEGGIYAVGGVPEADLNVTYNYSKYFSFRDLHGKTAKLTIPVLELAVSILGTERDTDYWASTPGNCGYALSVLLGWARLYPDAVWEVH